MVHLSSLNDLDSTHWTLLTTLSPIRPSSALSFRSQLPLDIPMPILCNTPRPLCVVHEWWVGWMGPGTWDGILCAHVGRKPGLQNSATARLDTQAGGGRKVWD